MAKEFAKPMDFKPGETNARASRNPDIEADPDARAAQSSQNESVPRTAAEGARADTEVEQEEPATRSRARKRAKPAGARTAGARKRASRK